PGLRRRHAGGGAGGRCEEGRVLRRALAGADRRGGHPADGDGPGPQGARPLVTMGWARLVGAVMVTIGLSLAASGAGAVESDPLPVPKGGPRERAVTAYNAGVKLL